VIFIPYHLVRIGILRKDVLCLTGIRRLRITTRNRKARTEAFLGVFEKLTEFLLSTLPIFAFFFMVDLQIPTISSETPKV
jgi:hypothetical protein